MHPHSYGFMHVKFVCTHAITEYQKNILLITLMIPAGNILKKLTVQHGPAGVADVTKSLPNSNEDPS